ncbi:FtsW/RodA/SpoVE family cell cycle protein [Cytobacillus purgationiresistens]|uniref:Probable peptidoglycan glycosyltransferase FtsW n=1 Tax=Cytobacillus purgationiresistens TaxID=863449 RepID=A0ABU0AMC5_9BACI|nr:FtsW/RodA/SpoVE family cell cycle protein [Cytobacillus purgationiresistens]MDQ0272414.1 cell division protein FtsW [Cytobacillus purgationiresistens]
MFKKILKSYDYSLIIVVALLCIFGLIMVYSSSMVMAVQYYGQEADFFYNKQMRSLIIACLAFIVTALFPYKALQSNRILVPMVFLSLLGLTLVSLIGNVTNNAQSWIKFGTSSIQPSEFVKLSIIIYLSAVYAKKQSYINEFNKGVVPPLFYLILCCVLVATEPDYGTAAIIFAIAGTIIFSSGMNFKNIFKLAFIGVIAAAPFVLLLRDKIFSDVRLGRVDSFLDPFSSEHGYQLSNAFIALGNGGLQGLGLGQSIQKMGYLPEGHTDFIMAIIAEELGFLGVSFVLLSLGFIVLKGIFIALKCKDPFGSLLAIGIASMIGIQSFVNLGGISGVIPLTGVPLPFISFGGSSLLQLSIAMGILVNVSMFVNYERKYKQKEAKQEVQPEPQSYADRFSMNRK